MTSTCYVKYMYIFILLTVQFYTGVAVFRNRHDQSCSSRPDMTCDVCNGVPECFDLSDELGCPNMTYKFIPIQEATKACMDKSCLKVFPGPPPLPPFSLCNRKQPTTKMNIPSTTKPTTRVPFSHATTKPSTEMYPPDGTTKTTTEMNPTLVTTKATTRSTCKTTRKTINPEPQFRTTTPWWEAITFYRPVVRPTTTTIPPWSPTPWTTSPYSEQKTRFMDMWRSCASVYYTNRNIFSCTVNCYFQPCNRRGYSKCHNICVPFLDNRRRIVAPTTASTVFKAVPTTLFPMSRYVTNNNNWFKAVPTTLFPMSRYVTNQNNWFGQSDFHPTDILYLKMFSEM